MPRFAPVAVLLLALLGPGPGLAAAEESVPPPAAAPAPAEAAEPAEPELALALSQSAPDRRIPWDRLDPADYLLVREVVRDAVVAQEVRDVAFPSRKAVFDFLIDRPDFAAEVARLLRHGRYRLRRLGDAYEADDGRGVHGVLRPMLVEDERRLFYLEGVYRPPLLPTLAGRLVLVVDTAHVDGEDGVTYCDMRVAGYLKLDQALPAAVARLAQGLSRAQVDQRVRRFLRHVAAVSRRAYEDPEGLAAQVAAVRHLPRDLVERFEAVLLAHRPPPWSETVPFRLLDGPALAAPGLESL